MSNQNVPIEKVTGAITRAITQIQSLVSALEDSLIQAQTENVQLRQALGEKDKLFASLQKDTPDTPKLEVVKGKKKGA